MSLFAGRFTKTIPIGTFQRLVSVSAPTAKPSTFINSKVHLGSFLRYSLSSRLPARGAELVNVGVTLLFVFFASPKDKPHADNNHNHKL